MQTYTTKIIELNSHDKDFAGFKWVLKAVNLDLGSALAKVISINLDGIVATDGHRLHIYNPEESYPIGTFKFLLRQKYYLMLAETKDVKFPAYQSVIPDYSKFNEFRMIGLVERDYVILIRNMGEQGGLRYKYFADMADMDKMYIGGEKEPVVLEGFRRQALIMPMRI